MNLWQGHITQTMTYSFVISEPNIWIKATKLFIHNFFIQLSNKHTEVCWHHIHYICKLPFVDKWRIIDLCYFLQSFELWPTKSQELVHYYKKIYILWTVTCTRVRLVYRFWYRPSIEWDMLVYFSLPQFSELLRFSAPLSCPVMFCGFICHLPCKVEI